MHRALLCSSRTTSFLRPAFIPSALLSTSTPAAAPPPRPGYKSDPRATKKKSSSKQSNGGKRPAPLVISGALVRDFQFAYKSNPNTTSSSSPPPKRQPQKSRMSTKHEQQRTPKHYAPSAAAAFNATPELRKAIAPPPNPGMLVLDKTAFDLGFRCVTASVAATDVRTVKEDKRVRGYLVQLPKTAQIIPDPDDSARRSLLFAAEKPEDLPEETRAYLAEVGATFSSSEIVIDWDNWNAHEILHSILPQNEEDDLPSSFTHTGHIAHMNLRTEWLPYKNIIGEVLVKKIPTVRTVVNKLDSIHSTFRFFDMEVLAGPAEFETTTSESGCTFTFDFSKVYWNSRLHTEHGRLIEQFAVGSVVADAMAGVGPFAVPAAKKGAYVIANDLNPESAKWMIENRDRNKVSERLRIANIDAREFIRSAPLEAWTKPFVRSLPRSNKARERERKLAQAMGGPAAAAFAAQAAAVPPEPQTIDHYVMNLPDSALEFLDAFPGAFTQLLEQPGYDREKVKLPLVHAHCFTRFLEFETAREDINARASDRLEYDLDNVQDYNLHLVRRVAPNKDMYCLTFRLPAEVAYRQL